MIKFKSGDLLITNIKHRDYKEYWAMCGVVLDVLVSVNMIKVYWFYRYADEYGLFSLKRIYDVEPKTIQVRLDEKELTIFRA